MGPEAIVTVVGVAIIVGALAVYLDVAAVERAMEALAAGHRRAEQEEAEQEVEVDDRPRRRRRARR